MLIEINDILRMTYK